jgi:hypothetical protein
MADVYTKEEYGDLVEATPSYNFINSINFFLSQGHAFNDPSSRNLQEHLTSEYPVISVILYRIPLRHIPLYINHESDLIKAIALWRLRISK